MIECEIDRENAVDPNSKMDNMKACAECGNISLVYQYDLCRACLSKSFKKLVKIIDSVRK